MREMNWTPARILRLRAHLRMSQAQFAAALGVHRKTVSYWELGQTRPWPRYRVLLEEMEKHT